jgi:hypothetical protein
MNLAVQTTLGQIHVIFAYTYTISLFCGGIGEPDITGSGARRRVEILYLSSFAQTAPRRDGPGNAFTAMDP